MAVPETRPYFEAVEEFLRMIQEHQVTSLCMVALCADEDTHDVVGRWNAGPFEMSAAGGVLQLHAALAYSDANRGKDDEDDESSD